MTVQSRSAFERQVAQKTQEQFQFYLLALVFTLLAASIQTAKFGSEVYADVLELSGWLFLATSGLAGLLHLESASTQRYVLAEQVKFEDDVAKLREFKLQGKDKIIVMQSEQVQTIDDQIINRVQSHKLLTREFERLDRQNTTKYQLHRWAFALGLLLVAGARAHPGITNILQVACAA